MKKLSFEREQQDIQWCPGCGNFGILRILKETLTELELDPVKTAIVSGIGQAAKLPHYLNINTFHSLHGRALPIATGLKAANPGLTVIAEGGDGDMYGEGGNHLIHTIRRNPDITNIVHNNMVYGLTKGQASPTSQRGFKTPVQVRGVADEPFNPLAVAISLGATFVGRVFSGHVDQAKEVIKRAIKHRGYALVDIFQPCVVFNKINTYKWFNEHVSYLDEKHDPKSRITALSAALDTDNLQLGVFYEADGSAAFDDSLAAYRDNDLPLLKRKPYLEQFQMLLDSYR